VKNTLQWKLKCNYLEFMDCFELKVTADAKNLIDKMLSVDPAKRINAKEALNHPWISQREVVASHSDRYETIDKLKKFLSARSRFRAVVFATIVAQRGLGFGKDTVDASEIPYDEVHETETYD
jgi:serine/threonine protein kinase